MKLKKDILKKLDNNAGASWIMECLDCSYTTAKAYIDSNSDNLTKYAMLLTIHLKLGLKCAIEDMLEGEPVGI